MLTKTKRHFKLMFCIILLLINAIFTTGPPVGVLQAENDTTGPMILVGYTGAYTTEAPGVWEIAINDPESGLAGVQILVDGTEVVQEALTGENARAYDVPVPDTAGLHELEVRAQNNDHDYDGDQEGCIYIETVEIAAPYVDDDTVPPVIILTPDPMEITDAEAVGGILVEWDIIDASGLTFATVWLNGEVIASYGVSASISGSYVLSNVPGVYIIDITARDNDNDPEHPVGDDWLESSAQTTITVIDDDTETPDILIIHEGAATDENPGEWFVYVEDQESGLDAVRISVDGRVVIHDQNLGGITSKSYMIDVPASLGIHTIEVLATDNDNDWAGDQQEITITEEINIIPPLPIFGLALAIRSPPRIMGAFSPPSGLSGKASGLGTLALQAPSERRIIFPDGDGDCVCDAADNCPLLPNPNQWDSDGDGIGDVCEEPVGAPLLTDAVLMLPLMLLAGALLLFRKRRNNR